MPLYDYECNKCGVRFQELVRLKDVDNIEIKCPKCKSLDVKRLFGTSHLRFKGRGFYATEKYSKMWED